MIGAIALREIRDLEVQYEALQARIQARALHRVFEAMGERAAVLLGERVAYRWAHPDGITTRSVRRAIDACKARGVLPEKAPRVVYFTQTLVADADSWAFTEDERLLGLAVPESGVMAVRCWLPPGQTIAVAAHEWGHLAGMDEDEALAFGQQIPQEVYG